jgi:hypothetical protein
MIRQARQISAIKQLLADAELGQRIAKECGFQVRPWISDFQPLQNSLNG